MGCVSTVSSMMGYSHSHTPNLPPPPPPPPRIPLTMPHEEVALIGCFRQTVDDLLVRMATDPSLVTHPPPLDEAILRTLSALVCMKSADPGTSQPTQSTYVCTPPTILPCAPTLLFPPTKKKKQLPHRSSRDFRRTSPLSSSQRLERWW